jgi:hypothetical protein
LKSLTVTDAKTGEPAPIDFPNGSAPRDGGLTEMAIHLADRGSHQLKLTYVTETPAWKPSYRLTVDKSGKVDMQAWAIVDNTSGEDWNQVKLGVGSSSALSFRFDLRSVRQVQRETLQSNDHFALAPPTGGATYGNAGGDKRVVGSLSDDAIALNTMAPVMQAAPMPSPTSVYRKKATKGSGSFAAGAPSEAEAAPQMAPPPRPEPRADVARMAQALRGSKRQVVVEGYADPADKDKQSASLERANRVREQLIKNGLEPAQVVALGQGEKPGQAAGVRVVEGDPMVAAPREEKGASSDQGADNKDPIGASHFESATAMTVLRGTSAMISILATKTDGEVVYLYDSESPRGNAEFPFKAVRLKNPTDSVLESGPVSVFGGGRFIGEGLSEPIPARSIAFVPFALDRQIVAVRKDEGRDSIARILSVQRGVFSCEVQHTRRIAYSLHNRLPEPAVVYVKHTVQNGYKLAKEIKQPEHLGSANLFRVDLAAGGDAELVVDESTPVYKTIDLRSPADMDQVRLYLSSGALGEAGLKGSLEELIKIQKNLGNVEQRIVTTREQMEAYRTRMNELHGQIVTLRLVKTGGALMKNLEKKLQDVSDKLSQATIDLAGLEEQAMLFRVHFQDGVADLSLEKKGG